MTTTHVSIRHFLTLDTAAQSKIAWFDWFCKDSALANKTVRLVRRLKRLLKSPKINVDTMYVFFQNHSPVSGRLFDDFRFCDIKSHKVLYTVIPHVGYNGDGYGKSEVWGAENDFAAPLIRGNWADVVAFFMDA